MNKEPLPRIDDNKKIREKILPFCRLKFGEIWKDSKTGHKVGCLDATNESQIKKIMNGEKARLAIQDPPYNVIVGNSNTKNLGKIPLKDYINWSKLWVENTINVLKKDSHFYIWLGADQNEGFQPLPDFMIMMRDFRELKSRSIITMRNQRGYGTQKNWMCIRQELLYYTMGDPKFTVQYTDIPKILNGYYKEIDGEKINNLARSRSNCIRPGNVWVDIQQVFYRMEENVPGCYAQKPIKSIERIILSSSQKRELIIDFFAHAGTSLLSAERQNRKCFTIDNDPIFAEITIRRLENFRKTGKSGWQTKNPFPEIKINFDFDNESIKNNTLHNVKQLSLI